MLSSPGSSSTIHSNSDPLAWIARIKNSITSAQMRLDAAKRLVAVFLLDTGAFNLNQQLDFEDEHHKLEQWKLSKLLEGVLQVPQAADELVDLVDGQMGNQHVSAQEFQTLGKLTIRRLRAAATLATLAIQADQLQMLSAQDSAATDGNPRHLALLKVHDGIKTLDRRLSHVPLPLSHVPLPDGTRHNADALEIIDANLRFILAESSRLLSELDEGLITQTTQNLRLLIAENHPAPSTVVQDRARKYLAMLTEEQKRATELMSPQLLFKRRAELENEHPPTIYMWYLKRSLALLKAAGHKEDSEGISLERLEDWGIEQEDLYRTPVHLRKLPTLSSSNSIGHGPMMAARQYQRYRTSQLAVYMRDLEE